MTIMTIDVSHHDVARRGGLPNWHDIAAAGLDGIMCARASYGDPAGFSPVTRYFRDFAAGAQTAGYTARGGYHNLVHGDQASINRQVDFLRRELDTHQANWAMADIEPYPELQNNNLWPRWADAQRFHDRWYTVDSRVCAWYIATWVWRGWLGQPNLASLRGPLINAHYRGGAGSATGIYVAAGGDTGPGWRSYGGRTPDLWQYTSSATVPGASNRTDCNAYRGTTAELIAALLGPAASQPQLPEEDDVLRYGRVSDGERAGMLFVSNGVSYSVFPTVDACKASIERNLGSGSWDRMAWDNVPESDLPSYGTLLE